MHLLNIIYLYEHNSYKKTMRYKLMNLLSTILNINTFLDNYDLTYYIIHTLYTYLIDENENKLMAVNVNHLLVISLGIILTFS